MSATSRTMGRAFQVARRPDAPGRGWNHSSHTCHTDHVALGRVVAGLTASLAVAGCAMVAIGMSQASSGPPADIAEPSATFRLPTVHTAKPTFAALSSAVPTTTTPERGTNSAVAPATASHP